MKKKLTAVAVRDAKSGDSRYTIWDTEVKGFGLRVNTDGSKTYILKYTYAGQQGWYTIGKHGSPYTADAARTSAVRLLGQVKSGIDPASAKKAEQHAGLTVSELCDRYLTAVKEGRVLTKSDRPKKATTIATDKGRIERHIKPLLGKQRVKDVSVDDVRAFLHDVAAGKTAADVPSGKLRGRAIVKGGKGTATRTVGLLGGIFGYAVQEKLRSDNPVRGVKRFADNEAERFLSPEEFQRLGNVLQTAEDQWLEHEAALKGWEDAGRLGQPPKRARTAVNPVGVAALLMLIITGCRKSEILGLEWAWVDLQRGYLNFPDSKTGKKAVPLSAAAADVLKRLPRLEKNPFVFVGRKPGQHLVGLGKIWERVRELAKLPDVRLHDLRHSFASVAASAGDSLLMIGALLGHHDVKTTKRYAHLANNPVKEAAERNSERIAEAMRPPRASSLAGSGESA